MRERIRRILFGVKFSVNRLAEKLGIREQVVSPCRTFNKKASVACYQLIYNPDSIRFDHVELLRAVSPRVGEYYVIPIVTLQKKRNIHLSYHRSGAFHWRDNGQRIVPADGETDYRNAARVIQHVDHLWGQLSGYCLAVGPEVELAPLKVMLHILGGYILYDLESADVLDHLWRHKRISLFLKPHPKTDEVHSLVEKSLRTGQSGVLSAEEIQGILRRRLEADADLIELDPRQTHRVALERKTLERILSFIPKMDENQNWPVPASDGEDEGEH